KDKKAKKYTFHRTAKENIVVDGKPSSDPPNLKGQVVGVIYEQGKYFGDPLTLAEQKLFAETYKDSVTYKDQLHDILLQVQPMTGKGEGVVQLRGWPYSTKEEIPKGNRFFHFLANQWDQSKDISEEAWIAQEDLWIQGEVYRMVRLANNYVSDFEGEGSEGK